MYSFHSGWLYELKVWPTLSHFHFPYSIFYSILYSIIQKSICNLFECKCDTELVFHSIDTYKHKMVWPFIGPIYISEKGNNDNRNFHWGSKNLNGYHIKIMKIFEWVCVRSLPYILLCKHAFRWNMQLPQWHRTKVLTRCTFGTKSLICYARFTHKLFANC